MTFNSTKSPAVGLNPFTLPPNVTINKYFDQTREMGVFFKLDAQIGRTFRKDFERSYDNDGYGVLGTILPNISGKSYQMLFDEMIVSPLGLDSMMFVRTIPDPIQSGKYGVVLVFAGQWC